MLTWRWRRRQTTPGTDAARLDDWPLRLRHGSFAQLSALVVHELAGLVGLDAEALASAEVASTVDLGPLAETLVDVPVREWAARVHAYYTPHRRALIAAGAEAEAETPTFGAARPWLRPWWLAGSAAERPDGDAIVTLEGPAPGTYEQLALARGAMLRLVTRSHFARWGVTLEVAFAAARENVIGTMTKPQDAADKGHPAVRLAMAGATHAGALLRDLGRFDPAAVGPLGTIAWAPNPSGIIYRSLRADGGLREDISWATVAFLGMLSGTPFVPRPLWRRPDGTIRELDVTSRHTDGEWGVAIGDAGLLGALAVLVPGDPLPVASWAVGVLEPAAYLRFTGLVSVALDGLPAPWRIALRPVDVRHYGTALNLPALARRCAAVDADAWPELIRAHLHDRQVSSDGLRAAGPSLVSAAPAPSDRPAMRYRHDVGEVVLALMDGALRTVLLTALDGNGDQPAYTTQGIGYPVGRVTESGIREPDEEGAAAAFARAFADPGLAGGDPLALRRLLADVREHYAWALFDGPRPDHPSFALCDVLRGYRTAPRVTPAGDALPVFACRADAADAAGRRGPAAWIERLPMRDWCRLAERLTEARVALVDGDGQVLSLPQAFVRDASGALDPERSVARREDVSPHRIIATVRPAAAERVVLVVQQGWLDGERVYHGIDLAGRPIAILERDLLVATPAANGGAESRGPDAGAAGELGTAVPGADPFGAAEARLRTAVETVWSAWRDSDAGRVTSPNAMEALQAVVERSDLWFSLQVPAGAQDPPLALFRQIGQNAVIAADSEIGSAQPMLAWTDRERASRGAGQGSATIPLPYLEACRLMPGLATRGIHLDPGDEPHGFLPASRVRALPEPWTDEALAAPAGGLPHRHRPGRIMLTTLADPAWRSVRIVSLSDARDGARYDVENRSGAFRRIDEGELVEPAEAHLVGALAAAQAATAAGSAVPEEERRHLREAALRALAAGYVWLQGAPPAPPNPEITAWEMLASGRPLQVEAEGLPVQAFAEARAVQARIAERPGRWAVRLPVREACRLTDTGAGRMLAILGPDSRPLWALPADVVRGFPDATGPAWQERSPVAASHGLPHAYGEDRIMLTRLDPPRRVVRLGALIAGAGTEPAYGAQGLDGRYFQLSEADLVAPGDLPAALIEYRTAPDAPDVRARFRRALRRSYVWLPLPGEPPASPERAVFVSLREGKVLRDAQLKVLSSPEAIEAGRPEHPDFWYVRLPLVSACQLAGDHGLWIDPDLDTALALPPDLVRALPGALDDDDPWFRGVPENGLDLRWRDPIVAAVTEEPVVASAFGWTMLSSLKSPGAGAVVEVCAVVPTDPLDAAARDALLDRLQETARRHGLPEGWHYRWQVVPDGPPASLGVAVVRLK